MTPTILYKCPGQHRGPYGTTYDFKGVKTQEETDSLLQNGWSSSIDEALESAKAPRAKVKIEVKTDKIEPLEVEKVGYTEMSDAVKESEAPKQKPKPKAKAKAKPKSK